MKMNKLCIFIPIVPSVGKQYTDNLRPLLNEIVSTAINEDPLTALIIVATKLVRTKFN